MSDILNKYFELSPNDDRDTATITWELGQQFESRGVDFASKDPEFAKYYETIKKQGQPSLAGEFTRGVARGVDQTQAMYYGGAALVADSLGWDGGKEWAMEGYQRNQDEAQENAATVRSYRDVDDIESGLRYATGLAGEVLPSGAEALVSGAATGGVGAPIARQFAKRAIKRTIAKRVAREVSSEAIKLAQQQARKKLIEAAAKRGAAKASTIGVGASSVLQNAGETYGELYDTAATRGDRIKASLVAGTVAGALDSIVPATVLRRMMPPRVAKDMAEDQLKKQGIEALTKQLDKAFEGYAPLKRKFLSTLAKDTGQEAWTEVAQELVQEVAQAYADPDYKFDADALRERLINSAIAGAVGGTQFGGVSSTVETYRQSKENKRLNDLQEMFDDYAGKLDRATSYMLRARQGTGADEYAKSQPVMSKQTQDLLDTILAENAGGEGQVKALIRYQDPETNRWNNAYVSGESIEQIVQDAQKQGIQNAEFVQLTDREPTANAEEDGKDTSEPTEEEVELAEKQIRKDGIDPSTLNEEDRAAIIQGTVEDMRERVIIGTVPEEPDLTKQDLLDEMREQIAEVQADESLSEEAKRAEILDIELSTEAEINAIGEEFVQEDKADNKGEEKAQDEGTNTPPVATEASQVTPSPVVISKQETATPTLNETYSDFGFIPMEALADRSIENELAAGSTDFDSENNRVKSKRFTRRAAVLRNTVTGEVEVRGAYKTDKGKVTLHGASNNEGMAIDKAISGWSAKDAKKNSRKQYKTDRPPHELIGVIEFEGSPVPFDSEDEKFFQDIKDRQKKGEKLTAKDKTKIYGITRRKGGYGNIYQTFPSIEALNNEVAGKIIDPPETNAERIERGEVEIVNPGEYIENLLTFSNEDYNDDGVLEDGGTEGSILDNTNEDGELSDSEDVEPEVFGVSESDSELIDPESLYVDEPTFSAPDLAYKKLHGLGMPRPEVEAVLAQAQTGTLFEFDEILDEEESTPAFVSHIENLGLKGAQLSSHQSKTVELLQLLYHYEREARTPGRTQAGNQGSDRGAQATDADLRKTEREPGRPEGENTGDAPAIPRQDGDQPAAVPERVGERPDADPQGNRDGRVLDWNRVDDQHVAFAGSLSLSVSGGPEVWDVRIDNLDTEDVLFSEVFIGTSDEAIDSLEIELGNQLNESNAKPEPKRSATAAAPAQEVKESVAQPDRKVPADKPKLVVIQGDRIPQVKDRVGDAYPLDDVGKQGVNLALAAHANKRPGFLLADGTGVGKSRQAIAVMHEIQRQTGGRVLYVTENKLQFDKFKREMATMGVTNPRIELYTYNDIGNGKLSGRKFDAIIYDEAHNLKNATAKKTKGIEFIKSDFTMFMTATPMDKNEAAAYFISTITGVNEETILNQIGLERMVGERRDGSFFNYIQKLEGVTNGEIRQRLHALRQDLVADGAMLRREYPFYGTRGTAEISLDESSKLELEEIEDFWENQENKSGRKKDLNRWLESKKEDYIYEQAKDDMANGKSVVIVAETVNEQWVIGLEGQTKTSAGGKKAVPSREYKGLVQRLAARFEADGIPFSKIYGDNNKVAEVGAFQSGENKLAIMTPASGGTGIDLDDQNGGNPRSVYVATMNFSGDVFEQVMGRFSRRNTMSPTELSFVTIPEVDSETHRAKILKEKLATLATFQGKQEEEQDANIRDLFSESMLNAPVPAHRASPGEEVIRTFNHTALPVSRVNTTSGIDYEISRITQPSPFLVDHHVNAIAREFSADADARVFLRNLLEAIPAEKLQTLDLRIVNDSDLPPGRYDPDRRLLILNKASDLNSGNGVALAFTHEMGHFFVNEVIGFDFVKDQWQSMSNKQRAAAHKQYLEANGAYVGDLDGAALALNDVAAQEWAAFQFTRIAREGIRGRDALVKQMKKEGASKSLIDTLTSWYDQLRVWISQWIGDADLSTTELDNAVMNALGIESVASSVRADAKRQQVYLATKAAENGYASIDDFAIEDLKGFNAAAKAYRESKTILNSPTPDTDTDDIALDSSPLLTYSLHDGTTTTERQSDPRRNLAQSIARQARGYVRRGDGSANGQKRSQRSLETWADAQGLRLDPVSFQRFIAGKKDHFGSEHSVYEDARTGRVVKVTHAVGATFGHSNNALDYLYELAASNKLFDDDIRLEGILITDEGTQIVTSQPFVKGRKATRGEIHTYLTKVLGLKKDNVANYKNEEEGISVTDVAPVNAIAYENENGEIEVIPIDFQVSAPDGYVEGDGWLNAPSGHRNKDIQKKLKDTEKDRAEKLVPEVEGLEDTGKNIIAQNAYTTHAELRDIAMPLYASLKQQKLFEGDFDSFYRKYTATPVTPSEAREYIGNLEADISDLSRTDLDKNQQRNVDDYILPEVYEARNKLQAALARSSKDTKQYEAQIEAEEKKLERHQSDYNNAEALERGAVSELKGYLKGFKKALSAKGAVAKLGRLGEIIRQLEGKKEVDNRIARKYTLGIERLIASEEPFVLFDLLEAVADSEIQLTGNATTTRNRFAEAGITSISSLSDEKFAAVLAIAQADKHLLDSIILRKLPDVEEKIAIVESEVAESNGDFKRSSKAITRIKKFSALKGRLAGQRALSKGKVSRWKSRIKQLEKDQQIQKQALDHYNKALGEVYSRVGGTVQGHVVDGTNLMIPASAESTMDEILSSTRKFRYGETTQEDVTKIIAAQKDWLDGAEAEANREADPLFYNQVRTQSIRLMERMVKDTIQTKASSLSKNWFMDALSNSFDKLNLPGARAVSQMLNQFISLGRAEERQAAILGEKADTIRAKLARELGYDKTPMILAGRIKRELDKPMKRYMETRGATIGGFINAHFPEASDKTKRLIREYHDIEAENGKLFKDVTLRSMSKAGLGAVTNDRILVPDYANDGALTPIEQTHRNIGTSTFLIKPDRDVLADLYREIGEPGAMNALIKEAGDPESAMEDEQIDQALDQIFQSSEGYDLLIGELARKEGTPIFSMSAGGSLVSRVDATSAYESTDSASGFFRALYEMGLDEGDLEMSYGEYVAEQMSEVLALYNDAAKTHKEFIKGQNSTAGGESHVGIDARKGDHWPTGWISYRMAGATQNHVIINQNVKAAIFGKNNERLDAEKAATLAQLQEKIGNARKEKNIKLESKLKGELQRVQGMFDSINTILGSTEGPLKDHKLAMEIMGSLVGGVLSGPRAAMVQLNQIYQTLLVFGLSKTSARISANMTKRAVQDIFGSVFQAFGVTLWRDSQAFNDQVRLYGMDSDTQNGFMGAWHDIGIDGDMSNKQKWVRRYNNLMRRGFSKAKAEEAIYTSAKPHNPFSWLMGALNKSPMMAFRSEFDRLAARAIDYAAVKMPEGGDLTKLKFDHETLGYRGTFGFGGDIEFGKLNAILEEKVGTTLADVVARHRANPNARPFTDFQYQIISSVGIDVLASEANVFTTRSPQMHTKMGRFIFPLIGWSLQQPHVAAKAFKGADGEFTKRTMTAGIMTMGFGLVPAVMMMAVFEDWFDENVMGKKRNLRPLTGAGPLDTANAVLERVTRNGMLGMPMEFLNLAVNIGGEGDMRTASLDQRVFMMNSIRGAIQLVGNVSHQRGITWESGGRQLAQTAGLNGFLQQLDMFSTLLDADNMESRAVARINAGNYIKVGGRMIGLETRPFSGSVTPTPLTPWITKMQVSAQANDGEAFRRAYQRALEAARVHLDKTGPREAEDYVAQNWSSRHPLKTPFRSPPTPQEYQQLLQAVGETGARDIGEYVNQYNLYGQQIGAKPYVGKASRSQSSTLLSMRNIAGY